MAMHVVEHPRPDGTYSTWDNQIRTHGSVDYTSIVRRFSHGCHRLHNHLAIRLFGFVLRHRPYKVLGQTRLAWSRKFQWLNERDEQTDFELKLKTRGYYFELVDPVPVLVNEGRVLGSVKKPIEEYIAKVVVPPLDAVPVDIDGDGIPDPVLGPTLGTTAVTGAPTGPAPGTPTEAPLPSTGTAPTTPESAP
jgi:hypothetical protein